MMKTLGLAWLGLVMVLSAAGCEAGFHHRYGERGWGRHGDRCFDGGGCRHYHWEYWQREGVFRGGGIDADPEADADAGPVLAGVTAAQPADKVTLDSGGDGLPFQQ